MTYEIIDLLKGTRRPPFATLEMAKAFAEFIHSGSDHAWSTDNLENEGAVCALSVRDEDIVDGEWNTGGKRVAEIVEVKS